MKVLEILVVPREPKEMKFSPKRLYHSKNFRYETLKSPHLKKAICVLLTSSRLKSTND